MEYRIVLLCIYISLSLYIAVSALDIKDRPTLNLISGGCTETIINPELITKESIPKKSKRKRIKSKFKKWLSVFSKLDSKNNRVLTYYGMMLAGAIARSASATAVHPLNVVKTRLQTKNGKMPEFTWEVMTRGAGTQFLMSIPHGAMNYAVTETTKIKLAKLSTELELSSIFPKHILDPILDFLSSAISTFICSVISTPQMVLTDRIMAGQYKNLFYAIYNIALNEGFFGFYRGWLPALVQKIPSYALTWMFFQQVKATFLFVMSRPGTTLENTLLGSFAAAGACCVMIPVDTVKTRIVMQARGAENPYRGIFDCFNRIIKEEGPWSLYKSLPPRLCAVMPMIGIQFSVYELIKRILLQQPPPKKTKLQENSQPTFSAGKSVGKKQEEATAGRILVDDNCTVSNNVGGQAVEGEESRAAGGSTTLRMYDQIATESPLVDEKVIEAIVETIETVEVKESNESTSVHNEKIESEDSTVTKNHS